MTLTRSAALSAALLIGVTAVASCARTRAAEEAYPPLGQFVTVNDRRVHYVQEGSGPDLVLIHGASGNVRDWTFRFVDRVKDRYRVTVFDRPGLGYTDPDPALTGPFDARAEGPEDQAALLHAAAEQVGVSNEVVVGHSYGGAVAMAWALNHDPAAAVVVSGATQPWPGGLGFMYNLTGTSLGGATFVPLVSAFVPRGIAKTAIAAIFDPNTPPDGYADYVGAGLTLRAESFRTNAQQVKTLRPHVVEMSKRYPDLRLPLEIVHGLADDVVPIDIHSEKLVEQVPGANLTALEGVGHMPHHIAPQVVEDAIDRAASRAGLR
ncbi:Soluble epoxide hydrolase [Rhodobacteraceae bacterium THAF1]|uniref:alpha/beta fold hydrolase n=1 Tax=Palleronia sp. THAF1 TaxID=2587842 RepID=UPI000F3AFE91|nr:alpha/beta hydrolase [Palleronia sp. THAF1]QFU08976.1 Soluble epoxide hydrolase [Palleronia sp. THAF1]VDC24285.1 Soluble epoxide hydrolase [Rhodobacteraceae bacterium THAF1]